MNLKHVTSNYIDFILLKIIKISRGSLSVDEIMPISLIYKRFTLKKLNQTNDNVTLNIFSTDDAFMDHVENRIRLKG